jgi:hypothetical protein
MSEMWYNIYTMIGINFKPAPYYIVKDDRSLSDRQTREVPQGNMKEGGKCL